MEVTNLICIESLLPLVYELEPHKVTGIVRYVGRVDSEFVDTRVYVGVKLDEPCKFLDVTWHHMIFPQHQMETQMVSSKENDILGALPIMADLCESLTSFQFFQSR